MDRSNESSSILEVKKQTMSLKRRRSHLSKNNVSAQLRNIKPGDKAPSEIGRLKIKMKKVKSYEEPNQVILSFILWKLFNLITPKSF